LVIEIHLPVQEEEHGKKYCVCDFKKVEGYSTQIDLREEDVQAEEQEVVFGN